MRGGKRQLGLKGWERGTGAILALLNPLTKLRGLISAQGMGRHQIL